MLNGPGFLVRDRWRCESLIVDGPHGAVWRACDQRLRRPVALRIVHAPLIGDPLVRRRVEKLLSITAELQHDNMAYLYDVFEEDGLGVVLISELIEGPTLSEVRARLAPLSGEVVAAIGVQLADGVAAIHAAGAAHRDLAPDNVRITRDGTVKILGFSAARLLADSTATPAAGVEDERSYLAPEQVDAGASDERSDIYAIGLLLWELATGMHPSQREGAAGTGTDAGDGDLPALTALLSDVAERLSDAVATATRRDPSDRWQDARDLLTSLEPLCPGRPRALLREALSPLLPDRTAS